MGVAEGVIHCWWNVPSWTDVMDHFNGNEIGM